MRLPQTRFKRMPALASSRTYRIGGNSKKIHVGFSLHPHDNKESQSGSKLSHLWLYLRLQLFDVFSLRELRIDLHGSLQRG